MAQIVPANDIAVATLALDAKLLATLRAGQTLQVTVINNSDGKPIPLNFSLRGLGDALDRVHAILDEGAPAIALPLRKQEKGIRRKER